MLLAILALIYTLNLYVSTAAPTVLTGDSAEFQFAAPLLAVPHPTGYPLYILLGKLFTLLPFGDLAYRVTLVSAVAGAATVAIIGLVATQVTGSLLAGAVAATALAATHSLWNAATIAEVYTLNTFFIALLAWTLGRAWAKQTAGRFGLTALVAGLGFSHHGSFALIAAPLLVFYLLFSLIEQKIKAKYSNQKLDDESDPYPASFVAYNSNFAARLAEIETKKTQPKLKLSYLPFIILCFGVGLTPWAFVLTQFAHNGPFNGLDYGLQRYSPGFYFWGAPQDWPTVINHLFGGTMRDTIFIPLNLPNLIIASQTVWQQTWLEFGQFNIILGLLGCFTLFLRQPRVWLGTVWVAAITFGYFVSLSGAVQDANMFLIPILLPFAIWIGMGAEALAGLIAFWCRLIVRIIDPNSPNGSKYQQPLFRAESFLLLIILNLVFNGVYNGTPLNDKTKEKLYRSFSEIMLTHIEPNAPVIVRWEHGTTLQYLRLVENQRPDIWLDITEPENESWEKRIKRLYPNENVYIIGTPADVANLNAESVWLTNSISLFRVPKTSAGGKP